MPIAYTCLVSNQRKQKTPKGHEIPIPKRKDFDAILNKVAKKPLPPRRPKK